jgi:hypothetical protein
MKCELTQLITNERQKLTADPFDTEERKFWMGILEVQEWRMPLELRVY